MQVVHHSGIAEFQDVIEIDPVVLDSWMSLRR